MSDYLQYPVCTNEDEGRWVAEEAIKLFETEAFNFALRMTNDTKVRIRYIQKARMLSEEYLSKIASKQITPYQAATEVNALRNEIMELARRQSSDIGKAYAQSLKATGRTLNDLCNYYAKMLFNTEFSKLLKPQQERVYQEIVKAAAKTRPGVNAKLTNISRLGKGLFILSIAIAVYSVATAEDKVREAGNQGVIFGGGALGAWGGGALAGLACGPGAPICVGIGVFVGAFIGGYGADKTYDFFF
jgi:hypothetical protein